VSQLAAGFFDGGAFFVKVFYFTDTWLRIYPAG
jgi:hypothetical protein